MEFVPISNVGIVSVERLLCFYFQWEAAKQKCRDQKKAARETISGSRPASQEPHIDRFITED